MSEWISVKDRLPDKDGKYLVWRVKYNGKHDYDCVDFLDDDFWSARVLYWMPLPEAGKEGEKPCVKYYSEASS